MIDSTKCELCPRLALPNDILCGGCKVRFDGTRPSAEVTVFDAMDRNLKAANFLRRMMRKGVR
jgi:hypothetical protein